MGPGATAYASDESQRCRIASGKYLLCARHLVDTRGATGSDRKANTLHMITHLCIKYPEVTRRKGYEKNVEKSMCSEKRCVPLHPLFGQCGYLESRKAEYLLSRTQPSGKDSRTCWQNWQVWPFSLASCLHFSDFSSPCLTLKDLFSVPGL